MILFFIYLFLAPLEYIQEKIPKGPVLINYSNIMLLSLVIACIMIRSAKSRNLWIHTPLNVLLLSYLGLTYVEMIRTFLQFPQPAMNPFLVGGPFLSRFQGFVSGFACFYFALFLLDSRRKMYWCLIALTLAMPVCFRSFYTQFRGVSAWHYSDKMRLAGPFISVGSNEFGAFVAYSMVFLGVFAFYIKRPLLKAWFWLGSSMYGYCVMYSYSRGTQLALGVGLLLMTVLRYRWALLIIMFLAATSSAWLPYSVRERWEKTETESGELESSARSREDFSRLALQLFAEQPIVGHGAGSFKMLNPANMDTHNLYTRTLAEMGLIGFFLLMAIWIAALYIGSTLWSRGPTRFDQQFGFCIILATVTLMVANIFGDRFNHLPVIAHYWALMGMGARLFASLKGIEPLEDEALSPVPGQADPSANAPAGRPDATPAPVPGAGWTRPPMLPAGLGWVKSLNIGPGTRAPRPAVATKPVLNLVLPAQATAESGPASRPLNLVTARAESAKNVNPKAETAPRLNILRPPRQ